MSRENDGFAALPGFVAFEAAAGLPLFAADFVVGRGAGSLARAAGPVRFVPFAVFFPTAFVVRAAPMRER
jgi:hypothetical protein